MPRLALSVALLGLVASAGHVAGQERWTPLGVAHQSPLRLLFLQLPPEPPALLPPGALALAVRLVHTNTSLREHRSGISAEVDVEQFHPSVAVEYGVSPRLQVGAELPFLYSWEGFLDPAIRSVERGAGYLRFVRKTQPTNGFRYVLAKDGETLLEPGRDGAGVGDLTLKAKAAVVNESDPWPAVSWRGALKLPTGEFAQARGSGHPDVAVGLLAGKRWGPVGVSLLGEWTQPLGNPFAGTGISVRSWITGTLTLDIALTDRLGLFGSLRRVGSPYRRGGLRLLTEPIWETSAGVIVTLSRETELQIGFVEDLFASAEVSSDFTIFVNVITLRL